MPIYEFRCKQCGADFEVMRSIKDESAQACETCASEDTERLISRTSFVLKGTGWYKTDYASPSSGEGGTSTGNTGSSSASSNSSSSSSAGSEE